MIALIVIAIIVVILILYIVGTYNGFVAMRNSVEEAFSTMDVYLKKRYDLIPNIVETVKGYAKHEQGTLEGVMQARNSAMDSKTTDEEIAAQGELQKTLGRLFAVAENYPDLKANVNFLDLQNQLSEIETEIAQSRKYYNAVVKTYNIKLESFPSNIIGNLFKFTRKPLYEVNDEAERENVKVAF
ncbi:LemA family protein [Erysipelotrichaceae bacterium OttesenSCG-928-M19]|nr:LemA family protein [Erysipelotrichaceae bacterium OttesenSCG-928-M19]